MSRSRFTRIARRFVVAGGLGLVLGACSGSGPQTSLEPLGPAADRIDSLWLLVYVIASVVFILVMGALVFAIIRFREKKGDERQPIQTHGNTRLEITWTIIPAVILAVITVPTVQGIFELREEPTDPDTIHINVTGHQWWWEYEYPGFTGEDGRSLFTANELHIPAGVPVYLTMTSADVIHSFWVPPLNGKRDVVPGSISNLILTADPAAATVDLGFGEGVILGQCAEFCGLSHADMRIRAFIHSQEEFQTWVDQQLQPAPVAETGPAADGFRTFTAVCTACHQSTVQQPDGTVETVGPNDFYVDIAGTELHSALAPDLTGFNSRTTFGGAVFTNDSEHLTVWLDDPANLKPMEPQYNDISSRRILGMPSFGLTAQEIFELEEMLGMWGEDPTP